MAVWPPDIIVEIFYDGAWHDITPDVRLTADIELEVGRRNEGAEAADPGSCTMLLNNGRSHVNPLVSGRYSTKNPRSDLFGKIGKGTRIRVRVDDPPAAPTPFLTDTFERTVSPGWGTADTGQTWFIQETVDNGVNDTDYNVANGLGNIITDSVNPNGLRMIQAPLVEKKTDFDCVCTVQIDTRVISTVGQAPVFGGFCVRVSDDGGEFITGTVRFHPDAGLPNDMGLRVATSIAAIQDLANVESVEGTVVPGLTYQVDTPINLRFRVEGPECRIRVWAQGETEPTIWHSQAHIESITNPGDLAMFTQANPDETPVPLTVSFDNISVADPPELDNAVRGVFEVYEWPPRWDISDSDVWVPIVTNGILRRLAQADAPFQSALRRYLPSLLPVAYWPLEDTGFIGRFGVEAVAGGQSLAIAGIKFAQDGDVPGSAALPELQASTGFISPGIGTSPFMNSGEVAATDTGSWSVWMLFNISADDFPDSGSHIMLQFYTTGTAGLWIVRAEGSATDPALRVRVVDQESVLLDDVTVLQSTAVAAGGPTITDGWRILAIQAAQNGANVDWQFRWFSLDGSINGGGGDSYAGTAGHFRRIGTTFSPSLKGLRFGHLSAWGFFDPVAYYDAAALGGEHATLGFAGEEARERARRVTVEENTLMLIQGNADTPMGAQNPSTLSDLVREAATADIGILTEQRNESGLLFRARELMYNQDPVLVFDYANGEVFDPFDPTDDDQRIQNSITVSREGGASASAVQVEGPLNINSPITDPNGVGEYPASYTINVESDDQLDGYAGWRLHLGTVDELRYPRVSINLANERIRPLIDTILNIREGTKIIITNPPEWLPADDIELIVEGYKEVLNAFKWEITLVCSPASPWTIGTTVALDTLLFEDFEDATLTLAITNGGDAAWVRTQADVIFGAWSFKAGAITDSQTSDAIIEVPDQAVGFRLWYKVSSESGLDFFQILVDGVVVFSDSGLRFWQQINTIDVTGATSVTLRYVKDAAGAAGDDTVYVDNVEFLAYSSGTEEPDRADTTKSTLSIAADNDDTQLIVLTEQPEDPFTPTRAEWVGAAIPINTNGDFETNLFGWNGVGATLARVQTPNETQQFGGSWSMQITPDGVTEFPNAGSDLFPVEPGRSYSATAWLRNDTTRVMSLSINWFDGGSNYISTDFRDQTVQANVWTFFDVAGTAPANAAFVNIAPTIPSFPAVTDVGYADEVFIRQAEPWSLPEEVPFNVRLSPAGGTSGEVVRVRSIEPLAWDTFTRDNAETTLNADPGAETGIAGWFGFNSTLASEATPGTPPFESTLSVHVTPTGGTDVSGNTPQTAVGTITPGETYAVESWVYSPGGWADMKTAIDFYQSDGTYISTLGTAQSINVPANTWTFIRNTGLVAPALASRAAARSYAGSSPTATDDWYADEVRVLAATGTWGTSDSGHTWSEVGGVASDRSTDGSAGVITLQANPSTIRFQQIPGEIVGDCDIVVDMSSDQIATGASLIPGVLLRAAGDYYRVRLHFGTSGSMFMSITRVVTQIGTSPTLRWTYTAGEWFRVRVRIVGQRILARAWPRDRQGMVEPTVWHIDRTVTDTPIDTGLVGVTCSAFGGNTNVNPAISYDNFQVVTPQRFVVDRGVNDVTRAHEVDTDVRLAQPAIVAL